MTEGQALKLKQFFASSGEVITQYYFGLSAYQVALYKINIDAPSVECHSGHEDILSYYLQMNSTTCRDEDADPFSQCKITHEFNVNVHYIIADSKYYKVIVGICVGVVSALILLVCFGYWFYKRYYKEELKNKE